MSERRCPHCGGLVAADAEWCGQCLNRLTDVPAQPPPAPAEQPIPEEVPAESPEEVPAESPEEVPAESAAEPHAPEHPGSEAPRPEERADARERVMETVPSRAAPRRPRTAGAPEDPFRMVDGHLVWTCPVCELVNRMETITCPRCGATFGELFKEPESGPRVTSSAAVRRSLLLPGLGHFAAGQTAEGVARGVLFLWAVGSLIGILLVRGDGSSSIVRSFLIIYGVIAVGLYVATAMDAARAARREPPLVPLRMLFYGAMGLMAVTVGVLLMGVGGS